MAKSKRNPYGKEATCETFYKHDAGVDLADVHTLLRRDDAEAFIEKRGKYEEDGKEFVVVRIVV